MSCNCGVFTVYILFGALVFISLDCAELQLAPSVYSSSSAATANLVDSILPPIHQKGNFFNGSVQATEGIHTKLHLNIPDLA